MKTIKKIFSGMLILISLFILAGCIPVEAGEEAGVIEWAEFLQAAIAFGKQVLALGGAAALVTVVINILKTLGIVKDGQSKTWSFILNAGMLAGMVVLKLFIPGLLVEVADNYLNVAAQILVSILGLVALMVPVSTKVHETIKGTAIVGKSYSLEG